MTALPPQQAVTDLRFWRCAACGASSILAELFCSRCLAPDLVLTQANGNGVVLAWCQFHRAYGTRADLPIPYTVLLIELEEGVRMYSNPSDLATILAIGTHVRAVPALNHDGRTTYRFSPKGEET